MQAGARGKGERHRERERKAKREKGLEKREVARVSGGLVVAAKHTKQGRGSAGKQ